MKLPGSRQACKILFKAYSRGGQKGMNIYEFGIELGGWYLNFQGPMLVNYHKLFCNEMMAQPCIENEWILILSNSSIC